jgi:hypothetical protein
MSPDTSSVDLGTLIQQLLTAYNGHAYPVVVALVMWPLIMLAKQGQFSAWLAGHIPSKAIPFLGMLLTVLTAAVPQIAAGVPWFQALLSAVAAGALPTWGHQAVIESMRSGKELVPATAKVAAQAPPQRPPTEPPSAPPTVPSIPITFVKSDRPPPLPRMRETLLWPMAVVMSAVMSLVTFTTGCSAQQWAVFEATTKDLVDYVNMFLPAIEAAWTIVLPLLGPKAADANAAFNKGVVDVSNAVAVLLDALHVADNMQQPAPDIAALIQDVKDAVARLTTIVDQYSTGQPVAALGVHLDAMHVHARAIAGWR